MLSTLRSVAFALLSLSLLAASAPIRHAPLHPPVDPRKPAVAPSFTDPRHHPRDFFSQGEIDAELSLKREIAARFDNAASSYGQASGSNGQQGNGQQSGASQGGFVPLGITGNQQGGTQAGASQAGASQQQQAGAQQAGAQQRTMKRDLATDNFRRHLEVDLFKRGRSLAAPGTYRRMAEVDPSARARARGFDDRASQYGGSSGDGSRGRSFGGGVQHSSSSSNGQGQGALDQGIASKLGLGQGGAQAQGQDGLGGLAQSIEQQLGGLVGGLKKERSLRDAVSDLERSLDEAGAAAHDERTLGTNLSGAVDDLGNSAGQAVDDITGSLGLGLLKTRSLGGQVSNTVDEVGSTLGSSVDDVTGALGVGLKVKKQRATGPVIQVDERDEDGWEEEDLLQRDEFDS